MLCTGKWVKKIVSCGGVFDLAVEQPQLFRKLPKNKTKQKSTSWFTVVGVNWLMSCQECLSVLGSLLFLLYTSELFSILKTKLISYVNVSSLIAAVPSPDVRP